MEYRHTHTHTRTHRHSLRIAIKKKPSALTARLCPSRPIGSLFPFVPAWPSARVVRGSNRTLKPKVHSTGRRCLEPWQKPVSPSLGPSTIIHKLARWNERARNDGSECSVCSSLKRRENNTHKHTCTSLLGKGQNRDFFLPENTHYQGTSRAV